MEKVLNFNLTAFSIFEKDLCINQRQCYYILGSERTINFLINTDNGVHFIKNQHGNKFCVFGYLFRFKIEEFILIV